MAKIKVLIADALPLFSESLAIAISQAKDISAFREYPANGPEAVHAAVRLKPSVALIDYWLPDMEGPVVTESIIQKVPGCKVILISWMFGLPHIQMAIDAGVAWLLPKDVSVAHVVDAIRRAVSGERSDNARQLQELIKGRIDSAEDDLARFQRLTPREIEVLALLNAGNTISQIAKRLSVSPKTVRNHISTLLSKTGTQSQIEAVAKARECGFLRI